MSSSAQFHGKEPGTPPSSSPKGPTPSSLSPRPSAPPSPQQSPRPVRSEEARLNEFPPIHAQDARPKSAETSEQPAETSEQPAETSEQPAETSKVVQDSAVQHVRNVRAKITASQDKVDQVLDIKLLADKTVGSMIAFSVATYVANCVTAIYLRRESSNVINEKIKDHNLRVASLNDKVFDHILMEELLDSYAEQVCNLMLEKTELEKEAEGINNMGGLFSWPRVQRGYNLIQPCEFPMQIPQAVTSGAVNRLINLYTENKITNEHYYALLEELNMKPTVSTSFIQMVSPDPTPVYPVKSVIPQAALMFGVVSLFIFQLVVRKLTVQLCLPFQIPNIKSLVFQRNLKSSPPVWENFRADVFLVGVIYAWSIGTQIYLNITVIYVGSSILIYMSERMPLLDWYLSTVGGGINQFVRLIAKVVTIVVVSPVAVLYEFGGFVVDMVRLIPTVETIYGEILRKTVKPLSGISNPTRATIPAINSPLSSSEELVDMNVVAADGCVDATDKIVKKEQVPFENHFPLKRQWKLKSFVALENCGTFYRASWLDSDGTTYLECIVIEIRGNIIFFSWL